MVSFFICGSLVVFRARPIKILTSLSTGLPLFSFPLFVKVVSISSLAEVSTVSKYSRASCVYSEDKRECVSDAKGRGKSA